jgi:hypothetical protein
MLWQRLWQRQIRFTTGSRVRPAPTRRRPRLTVEPLEDRAVPASFTAATVADLVADINGANQAGGPNTITLVAGTTFTLTAGSNGYGDGLHRQPQHLRVLHRFLTASV